MKKVFSWVQNHTSWVLGASLLLSVVGGYYSVVLYQNLRTDLEELLPVTARSVLDLNQVSKRLQSIDNLAVLVFSKQTQKSKQFVIDLVQRLNQLPKKEVSFVEYRISEELNFFKKRMALYMELEDLSRIKHYIQDKINYEIQIMNPLTIFSEVELEEPQLDFSKLKKKYEKDYSVYAHFPDGFFATPDETRRAILIDVPGKSFQMGQMRQLRDHIVQLIEDLKPHSYANDLEVHFTGSVEEMLEEQDALMEDLAISTLVVIAIVTLALSWFFRSMAGVAALVFSVFASTFWTFGVSYQVVGYLNANSAFLGSIVLGNGINFGIILLARYLEERRLQKSHFLACDIAMRSTAQATGTAALAAGISYGSLMLTSFRGFQQFGIIGLIGMLLSWIGAYTCLPALLTAFYRLGFLSSIRPVKRWNWVNVMKRYPRWIVSLAGLLSIASVVVIVWSPVALIETHLDHLRSKKSLVSGAAFYTQYINQIFQRFLTPLVILPVQASHVAWIAQKLKEVKKQEGAQSSIISVQTLADFIPQDQEKKHSVLKEIQRLLTPKILLRFSDEDKQRVKEFLTPEVFLPVQVTDLPPLLLEKFKEKDGSLGQLVLVEPPLTRTIWEGNHLIQWIDQLRKIADSVEPGVALAGGMAISADLLRSIMKDGPYATVVSFLLVFLLVVVLFRNVKMIFLSSFALWLGVLWFAAGIVLLARVGLKINFLNFVALPITFGIGIDYGVNIFQRYLESSTKNIAEVIRETGGAVALSSFTTMTGYSALLIASNQGFVSFGLMAVLGECCCVLAALVVLPALLLSLESK